MEPTSTLNEKNSSVVRFSKSFVSGFISGGLSKYIGHPLDTIKVRIQVSGTQIALHRHFSSIFYKEGVRGFYKGAISPVVGTAPVTASLFAVNDFSKRLLKNTPLPKVLKESLPGWIAGFTTLFFVVPTDLLKIKKQGMWHSTITYSDLITNIVNENGLKGLYRGFWISFWRIVPQYGITFYSYDKFGQLFSSMDKTKEKSSLSYYAQKLAAGGLAGQLCWLIGYPVDSIRTYIQYHPEKRSILNTTIHLYKTYGIKYFHRGCSVAMIRSIVVTAIQFGVYELINTNLQEL